MRGGPVAQLLQLPRRTRASKCSGTLTRAAAKARWAPGQRARGPEQVLRYRRYRIARTTFAGHARDLGPVPLPNASVLPGNSSSAPRYAVTPRYGAGSSLG